MLISSRRSIRRVISLSLEKASRQMCLTDQGHFLTLTDSHYGADSLCFTTTLDGIALHLRNRTICVCPNVFETEMQSERKGMRLVFVQPDYGCWAINSPQCHTELQAA